MCMTTYIELVHSENNMLVLFLLHIYLNKFFYISKVKVIL